MLRRKSDHSHSSGLPHPDSREPAAYEMTHTTAGWHVVYKATKRTSDIRLSR